MNFLGFDFKCKNLEDTSAELIKGVLVGNKYYVLTINALIAYEYLHNPEYKSVTSKVNYVVPDGAGVLKALKRLYGKIVPRVAGIDLMVSLCERSQERSIPIYLLGSTKISVSETVISLRSKFPNIKIVGCHSGFFSESENDRIISEINNSGAKLLFVGMGVPKQEKWIYDNFENMNIGLAMGVGGSFDVISGKVKRAPEWIQKSSLEWLFRILQEPGKRFKLLPKLISFGFYTLRLSMKKRGETR